MQFLKELENDPEHFVIITELFGEKVGMFMTIMTKKKMRTMLIFFHTKKWDSFWSIFSANEYTVCAKKYGVSVQKINLKCKMQS